MGLFRRSQSKCWWMSFIANGKQYQKSTGTKDRHQAERIYAKIQTQIVEDKFFESDLAKQHTLSELMDRYMLEVVSHKAPRTQETNKVQIAHLLSFFGDITLDKVTPESISRYRSKRLADGVKLQTIRYELIILSHAFNIAVREWQWVRLNPMKFIKMPRQENKIERWLTHEEQEKVLSHCEDWLKQLVIFDLHTGLRMNELLNLRWQDVDLMRKTAVIIESKNHEKRTLPLNEVAIEVLRDTSASSRIISMEGYVFTRDGKKIAKHELQYYFKRAVKRAKIAHCRFHDLRHTFATRLAQSGIDIYKIAKLLGHKDIKTTQRYAHHCPESLRDGVNILGSMENI
jgi:integrase